MVALEINIPRGSKIALVAPSAHFDHTIIDSIKQTVTKLGYEPVHSKAIYDKYGEMAGKDWIRAEDFVRWFMDPAVKVIWAIRGGYGSIRILNMLDLKKISQENKLFIGYSDITFLHIALLNAGFVGCIHGPNAIELINMPPEGVQKIQDFFKGKGKFEWKLSEDNIIRHGSAYGHLIGGNLTCLSHLLGTPYLKPYMWEGALLFIEDNNEAGYRIDRMLNHLKIAGVFEKIKGLILGNFSNCESKEKLISRVNDIVSPFDFPVIFNMPFGHDILQDLLPLGVKYQIDTYQSTFRAV